MADVIVGQVGLKQEQNIKVPSAVYLVSLVDPSTDTDQFLAVVYEDCNNFVKVKGFYTSLEIKKIKLDFKEIVASVDKACYTELHIPWTNILTITNLSYRKN
jgi:hypothetical protein